MIPAKVSFLDELLTQAQPRDDLSVPIDVFVLHIFQQRRAVSNHLQQPSSRGVVLFVHFEVSSQLIDPTGENGDLHFWRAGVAVAFLVLSNHFLLLFFRQHTYHFSFQTVLAWALLPITTFFLIFQDVALYNQ